MRSSINEYIDIIRSKTFEIGSSRRSHLGWRNKINKYLLRKTALIAIMNVYSSSMNVINTFR